MMSNSTADLADLFRAPIQAGDGVVRRAFRFRMGLTILFLAVLNFLLLPQSAFGQSVTAEFSKARTLYERGETKKAARILTRLSKRFPDHQPTSLLLGRIYYGAGDVERASRLFAKVGVDLVPPDMAFEYGAAMFADGKCERAIRAFSRVPAGNTRDIASFYSGVCFMRLKQWHKAGVALRKAQRLPPNLAASRRRLLRTLQDREREDRFGGTGGSTQPWMAPSLPPPVVQLPPPGATPQLPTAPGPGGEPPKKAKPAAPPPAPKLGFSIAATPGLTATSVQQRDDNHGFRSTDTKGTTTEGTLGLALRYDGAERPGGQPAFTLNTDLGRYSTKAKGQSTAFKAFDDDPSAVFTEVKEIPIAVVSTSSDGTALRTLDNGEMYDYRVTLGTLQPVSESIDVELRFALYDKFPGMTPDRKAGTRTPSGRFAVELGALTLELNVASTDTLDAKGKSQNDLTIGGRFTRNFETMVLRGGYTNVDTVVPEGRPLVVPKSVGTADGSLARNWESFSLTGTVRHTTRTPMPEQTLSGALTTLRGELSGRYSLGIGAVTATGFMAQLGDFRAKGLDHPTETGEDGKPRKVEALATGAQQGGTIAIRLTPLPWLWLSSGYTVQQSVYSVSDKTLEKKFQAATTEVRTIFTYALGVSKTF